MLAQARGDHAAMVEALAAYADPAVHDPVDRVGVLPWRALRVEALLGLGRIDEAEAALAELEERVAGRPRAGRRWRRPGCGARSPRSRAAARRGAPGLRRGRWRWRSRCPPSWPGPAWRSAYGRYLLAAGERRPAVDLLRTAHARLDRLGAAPFLERCDALLRAAGLHPPAAGGTLELTPQELAVARLVAEGRTNQEAGAALFVTGRTVAFHLSNIYAKLGVSSRRELAARLQQRNWQVRWKVLTVPPAPGRGTLGHASEPRAWRGRCDC